MTHYAWLPNVDATATPAWDAALNILSHESNIHDHPTRLRLARHHSEMTVFKPAELEATNARLTRLRRFSNFHLLSSSVGPGYRDVNVLVEE